MMDYSSNQQGCDQSLVINIKDMLRTAPSLPSGRDCCIHKVPVNLRNINEAAYTPQIISIGPLHLDDKKLQPMQVYKKHLLNNLLRQKPNIHLEDYVETLRGLEKQVRNCYFDQEFVSKISSNDFIQMMLLDGCFIVQLFTMYSPKNINEVLPEPYTPIVISDIMLFENQLPYFLLEHLFNFINDNPSFSCTGSTTSFKALAGNYFCYRNFVNEDGTDQLERSGYQVKHFLDLILYCHLPSGLTDNRVSEEDKSCREPIYLPSATELRDSGVKFKKGESHCYLDITFKKGVLEIPTLDVEDGTEQMFRNIIAMEQCHVVDTAYITHYRRLLDFLINTPYDVALLRRRGIINNYLGSDEEVAEMVNKLGSGVFSSTTGSPYYGDLKSMDAFYKRRRNKWRASLRRQYFKNPWKITSLSVAIVFLICTVAQTVCSILSVKK